MAAIVQALSRMTAGATGESETLKAIVILCGASLIISILSLPMGWI
jgi:hypothetical protein